MLATRTKKKKNTVSKKTEKSVRVKPIGRVTHYFAKIKVAIVKFKQPVKIGADLKFQGATTDFMEKIASMQYDHAPIRLAKKNQEIGVKLKKRVREGDEIYFVD